MQNNLDLHTIKDNDKERNEIKISFLCLNKGI